jgi:hypothetical protein
MKNFFNKLLEKECVELAFAIFITILLFIDILSYVIVVFLTTHSIKHLITPLTTHLIILTFSWVLFYLIRKVREKTKEVEIYLNPPDYNPEDHSQLLKIISEIIMDTKSSYLIIVTNYWGNHKDIIKKIKLSHEDIKHSIYITNLDSINWEEINEIYKNNKYYLNNINIFDLIILLNDKIIIVTEQKICLTNITSNIRENIIQYLKDYSILLTSSVKTNYLKTCGKFLSGKKFLDNIRKYGYILRATKANINFFDFEKYLDFILSNKFCMKEFIELKKAIITDWDDFKGDFLYKKESLNIIYAFWPLNQNGITLQFQKDKDILKWRKELKDTAYKNPQGLNIFSYFLIDAERHMKGGKWKLEIKDGNYRQMVASTLNNLLKKRIFQNLPKNYHLRLVLNNEYLVKEITTYKNNNVQLISNDIEKIISNWVLFQGYKNEFFALQYEYNKYKYRSQMLSIFAYDEIFNTQSNNQGGICINRYIKYSNLLKDLYKIKEEGKVNDHDLIIFDFENQKDHVKQLLKSIGITEYPTFNYQ